MASWHDVEAEAPELAARARELFDANKHKTLATLRRDGSPRIGGIEAGFEDGELWFGSMWRAVKALDLQRDPRFAIHSASDGADFQGRRQGGRPGGGGQLRGALAPVPRRRHRARRDRPRWRSPDHLVIESWHAGRGVTTRRR